MAEHTLNILDLLDQEERVTARFEIPPHTRYLVVEKRGGVVVDVRVVHNDTGEPPDAEEAS